PAQGEDRRDIIDDEPRNRQHEELREREAVAILAQKQHPRSGVQEVNDEPDEHDSQQAPACSLDVLGNPVDAEMRDEVDKRGKSEDKKPYSGRRDLHAGQNTEK